jgi:hypothetical protein
LSMRPVTSNITFLQSALEHFRVLTVNDCVRVDSVSKFASCPQSDCVRRFARLVRSTLTGGQEASYQSVSYANKIR